MLEARGLTKRYSRTTAVDGVSFTVRPYELLGYLGPNGSGKSTTVNMLTGLVEPTQGEVLLEGRNIRGNLTEYKRRLGYVPEEPRIYPYLTGKEFLQLVGRLRGIPEAPLNRKIEGFLELFSLGPFRYSPLSAYSKGMTQKVLIIAALLHNPDILIFDEPLSGLDVASALVFRNLVRTLAAEGKIVFYTSHVLEVVEKLCSRVIILHKGKVVADDSVGGLRHLMKLPSLEQIFAQLVVQEDTDRVAREMVGVMRS